MSIPTASAHDPEWKLQMRRVYAFLRDHPGPKYRDQIMLRAGFSHIDRVTEFVQFENTILRINAKLRGTGTSIVRHENGTLSLERSA